MSPESDRPEQRLHFRNPPIVEAAIGITIPRLSTSRLDDFRTAEISCAEIRYQAPTAISQNRFEMSIVGGQSVAQTRDELLGWRWVSDDNLHILQFKLDGFAFSRMGRYETWESFTSEARRLWDIYLQLVGPTGPTHFGVRYINKVFIPFDVELGDYLRVFPMTPPGRQWLMHEALMRLGVRIDRPLAGQFTHQHLLVPSDMPDHAAVILDNDFQYPVSEIPTGELWNLIDAVRDVKDEYFLQVTTPRLQETFNV